MNTVRNIRLLLVEDDPAHAELVRLSIEECGDEITSIKHVCDGVEAWEYLQECFSAADEHYPDLILLDVRMPRMNGIELLKRIKSHDVFKQIPAIVLTTSASKNDRADAYTNHANSFLTKPVGFQQFQSLIQELNDYWIRTNQPPHIQHDMRMSHSG